jgi:2-dehydropantoate 2-reductase
VGGQLRGPGEVFAGVSGKRTVVGELDGTRSARLDRLAEQWTAAGVPVEVSESITSVIWDKLLTNVATGALSAITGLAYGGLYAVPELQEIGCAAAREAMAVATAAGVPLLRRDALEVWRQAGEGLGPDFRASMLLSLDAGAPTEVDVVIGAVVRVGAGLGVPTPVNEVLVAAVRGRERAVGAATRRD